jgi:alkanesulfonate monooxygenase SsuD/methylene tetrahydromethanopterin reductase-like flavin-dependent oxidoreductase (luciferase family)
MAGQVHRRVTAVRECIEILNGAHQSAKEAFSYKGDLYTVRNYRAHWVTAQAPQIYVGANGPQMFQMAARVADGIMMSDFTPSMVTNAVKIVDENLTANKRSKKEFCVNNYWAWHIKEDKEEAVKEARRNLALRGVLNKRYLETFMNEDDCNFVEAHAGAIWRAFHQKTHVIDGVPERIINALIDNLTSTGDLSDVDRLIEKLCAFKAAGLTEIALGLHDDPAAAIKIIGEKVVPAFS